MLAPPPPSTPIEEEALNDCISTTMNVSGSPFQRGHMVLFMKKVCTKCSRLFRHLDLNTSDNFVSMRVEGRDLCVMRVEGRG